MKRNILRKERILIEIKLENLQGMPRAMNKDSLIKRDLGQLLLNMTSYVHIYFIVDMH